MLLHLKPVQDIAAAFMLLTRVPVRWSAFSDEEPNLGRSLWAYPLVGGVVSAVGSGVFWFAHGVLPDLLCAFLALLSTILMTGAFHEDGLADVADGFGGGFTKERKLEIMRDSRVGTYGTVAVLFSLGLRASALAALPLALAVPGFIAAGAASRMIIILMLRFLPPARKDGMGTVAGRPGLLAVLVGSAIGIGGSFLLLPYQIAPLLIAATLAGAVIMARVALKQIGGFTGDVLGAGQQVAETFALIMLAAIVGGAL